MKGKGLLIALIAVAFAVLLVAAVAAFTNSGADISEDPESESSGANVTVATKEDINDRHIRDNQFLYEGDDPFDVVTMYLTVSYGNATDGTNHTWEEINKYSTYYYEDLGIERYKVAGLLQVGDENGPTSGSLGYGRTIPNATVQIRGQTSSLNPQKNYKIKILDGNGDWNGQKTIALNKHMTDGLRFRNKLSFDLMSEIPEITSLRTQFVHLYVRDTTGDNPDEFVDYGLYTQIEQLNQTALRAHGFDKNAHLYKINFFEFLQYDAIRTVDDPEYDEKEFNTYLETKGNSDHSKLIRMIDAVNDYSIPSDELLEKYFDTENIAYWMAFTMLIGNSDVQSRNMYIYSPLNSETWYILPWDFDCVYMDLENEIVKHSDFKDWQKGISNYWGNVLFKRALMSENFREELDAAVTDLLENYLSIEKIAALSKKYAETVKPYAYTMPDIANEPLTKDAYDEVLEHLPYETWDNYDKYRLTLESPMPFFNSVPEKSGNNYVFSWGSSYDMLGGDVKYQFILARDPEFKDVIFKEDDVAIPTITKELTLSPGQYFIHTHAVNSKGNTMNCFDQYKNEYGAMFGVFCFFVDENGQCIPYEDVEGRP